MTRSCLTLRVHPSHTHPHLHQTLLLRTQNSSSLSSLTLALLRSSSCSSAPTASPSTDQGIPVPSNQPVVELNVDQLVEAVCSKPISLLSVHL
jgi:hypothetical protein